MVKHILPVVVVYIATMCPVFAWTVTHERDRMTDKNLTWASVTSGNATLLVGCLNGKVQPRLTWDQRIGWGNLGASFRYGDGPVTPRFGLVSQDGRTLYLWVGDYANAVGHMKKDKRLRVSIGQAFYDFDLTHGEPMPAIKCN
jgi:hypothetical protein